MEFGPILFFVLFAALVIAIVIYSAMAAAKRRKELAAWGSSKGLTFDEAKDRSTDERFPAFKCLRQGDGRYSFNHLRGRWSKYDFLGFDYHYETHSTDSKGHRQTHHHHFSAVILGTPLRLRPLFIRPEGFFDKLSAAFGFDDIDFESTEFSKRFYVKSPDKKWAYDVLHARTMQFLLDRPAHWVQLEANHAIVWRERTFQPRDFETATGVLSGVLDALPEYLVKELQTIG